MSYTAVGGVTGVFQEGVATAGESKDGWSFEVDEEDVNKLLETEELPVVEDAPEERTDLEDVFR